MKRLPLILLAIVLLTLSIVPITYSFYQTEQENKILFSVGNFITDVDNFDKNTVYKVGDMFIYNGKIFVVVYYFNPNNFLNTDGTLNLDYVRPYGPVQEITSEYREYNTYYKDDQVSYNNYIWQVRHEGANWNPPESNTNSWQRLGMEYFKYNTYTKGDTVLYQGALYESLGYNFNNTPDLTTSWVKIG